MSDVETCTGSRYGFLAREILQRRLPLRVLKSAAGYYLGTFDEDGPCTRESVEYWHSEASANQAMTSGNWTQRLAP